jgi:hypothetical protein
MTANVMMTGYGVRRLVAAFGTAGLTAGDAARRAAAQKAASSRRTPKVFA